MKQIRVLVADDSLFMRKMIVNLLQESPDLMVVGEAKNGVEAVEMVSTQNPDVVTMDVEMPRMNGLEAVKHIMSKKPVPVIMFSSLTESAAKVTIEALAAGAFDFLQKPGGSKLSELRSIRDEMVSKIRLAARAKTSDGGPVGDHPQPVPNLSFLRQRATPADCLNPIQLVVIGTSTGGPNALSQLVPQLSADLPIAVLVVQHMPALFTSSLARRLDSISQMRVVEAQHNEMIRAGTVYVAPGSHHMTVTSVLQGIKIQLHQGPTRNGHRPSVDVLFESVAKLSRTILHFVLMTGMGADGAVGMAQAASSGAFTTIAEAAETCVVYGMPRAAVQMNCVDYELPLPTIASQLISRIMEAER